MPTNAERARCVTRALEATLAGDVSRIDELFTRDVVGSSPVLTVSCREELAIELEERRGALADVELVVQPLDVGGDRACVEWVASGVHCGRVVLAVRGEDTTFDPTGRRVVLRGVTVAEFAGCRIRAFRHYWQDLSLLGVARALPDRGSRSASG